MYVQRYLPHFPAAGEVVNFDRSCHNRAGVERVMDFCTEEQAKKFLSAVPLVEKAMVDSGIVLLKYWLGEIVQRSRPDGLRHASTTGARSGNSRRWISSRTAAGTTIPWRATKCSRQPIPFSHPGMWRDRTDKKRARLNIITHLLGQVPYEDLPRERVVLPKRQKSEDYREPEYVVSAHPGTLLIPGPRIGAPGTIGRYRSTSNSRGIQLLRRRSTLTSLSAARTPRATWSRHRMSPPWAPDSTIPQQSVGKERLGYPGVRRACSGLPLR